MKRRPTIPLALRYAVAFSLGYANAETIFGFWKAAMSPEGVGLASAFTLLGGWILHLAAILAIGRAYRIGPKPRPVPRQYAGLDQALTVGYFALAAIGTTVVFLPLYLPETVESHVPILVAAAVPCLAMVLTMSGLAAFVAVLRPVRRTMRRQLRRLRAREALVAARRIVADLVALVVVPLRAIDAPRWLIDRRHRSPLLWPPGCAPGLIPPLC
jgi:hypothetical protein